jgi:hypothetical protein
MRKQSAFRIAGAALVALGAVGVFTVADDTRHLGELAGVASVVTSGLAFLGAASKDVSSKLALQWLPAGLAVGLVVGLATDRAVPATAGGFVLGLVLAYLRRDAHERHGAKN